MNPIEELILKKLSQGDYDGVKIYSGSYGNVKKGGRYDTGVVIEDGCLYKYKDRTTKYFNGEENEKKTENSKTLVEDPEEVLKHLACCGWKLYDHEEVRGYSRNYLNSLKEECRKNQESETNEDSDDVGTDTKDDLSQIAPQKDDLVPFDVEECGLSKKETGDSKTLICNCEVHDALDRVQLAVQRVPQKQQNTGSRSHRGILREILLQAVPV